MRFDQVAPNLLRLATPRLQIYKILHLLRRGVCCARHYLEGKILYYIILYIYKHYLEGRIGRDGKVGDSGHVQGMVESGKGEGYCIASNKQGRGNR